MSAATYPVRVDARLDPQLSRWLWAVKWVLAIPHHVVLAFLWMAFAVLSVGAFVGILFTGRCPVIASAGAIRLEAMFVATSMVIEKPNRRSPGSRPGRGVSSSNPIGTVRRRPNPNPKSTTG